MDPDKKSAPGFSAPAQVSGETIDLLTEANRRQDRQRARRLLGLSLTLLGEAGDCAFHADAEDVELHAIRAAQIACHAAIEFLLEEDAK